ncbi:FtsK/SpoIIIE domain-containing protein [Microbacterium sp. RD1]|uniref:FtsK/SpoIIIE domain-containing protein n=1 Tax=Microbacterium sp. RD1 TaxID=3457313 RepID=UPI003FA5AA45
MSATGFAPSPARADDDAPLVLPTRPAPPARPGVPWLASAVPVVGALGFWAFTGSAFVLWFALLGPVIAIASVADGVRTAHRDRRRADLEGAQARERIRERLTAQHAAERAAWDSRHPDVAGFLERPERVWRAAPDRETHVVVGRGRIPSAARVTGASEHPDDLALVAASRRLSDAPLALSLAGGLAVVGPPVIAQAVARALVLQLACALPPGEWESGGAPEGEEWVATLPHSRAAGRRRMRWIVGTRAVNDAEIVLRQLRPGEAVPPDCRVVMSLLSPARARVEADGVAEEVEMEGVGRVQARHIAQQLSERAADGGEVAAAVALTALRASERTRDRHGLPVVVGTREGAPLVLDLVADGPHAVVTGMTGAGKSELLVTWVTALSARYTTADVCFLLADFKGGTAFEPLRDLPHVTGVLTDLDARGAARAITSLRAEIRAREALLARAGERDVASVDVPRLVIVVDEFAALRDTHPELESLFSDLAARGRALGMHLVLGTQRAGGVLRDALLANCPLRISLRVADPADSSAVLGSPDAAAIPGGEAGRGVALIRRAADARAGLVRIAMTTPDDIAAAAHGAGPRPRAAWMPELPHLLPLEDVAGDAERLVLGLRDEPEQQRHVPWLLPPTDRGLLIVGGPGSGKTSALRTIAAQAPVTCWIGTDPEAAWDTLIGAAMVPRPPGSVVLIDDLDALAGRFPDEYARAATAAIEGLIRDAGHLGLRVVATAQRLTGIAGRVADLFPRRVVLATPTRAEHVAAGGEAGDYAPEAPPGRGVADRHPVQFAFAAGQHPEQSPPVTLWQPPVGVSGYIGPRRATGPIERWERTGVRVRSVDAPDPTEPEPGGAVLVTGDPEQWLGHPRLLERMRAAGVLVIDAACQRDLRILTGERDLPPFADPLRGRAWLLTPGSAPRRVAVTPSSASGS